MIKRILKIFLFLVFITPLFSQQIDSIDVKDQSIADILMVLARAGGKSIVPDETVHRPGNLPFLPY